ncbi:MAG: Mut7-C RNAse domain-containing protein [Verrucomicrobiota bacterium]|nr:Mut7-C RNAse domain-containing protein [Verrucomicrobiota bacterium]
MGARCPDKGVNWLLARAAKLAADDCLSETDALAHVAETLLEKHARAPTAGTRHADKPQVFWCDAGLGGLARWLRAAGYVARWEEAIDDADLLARAENEHAAVISTDSLLLERRNVVDGRVRVFWVPPACGVAGQMRLVLRRWNLVPREPLCMLCSGVLDRVDKESVRDRIPPRTYRWLDEYYVCRGCGRLFWRGTHWQRIRNQLERLCGEKAAPESS